MLHAVVMKSVVLNGFLTVQLSFGPLCVVYTSTEFESVVLFP